MCVYMCKFRKNFLLFLLIASIGLKAGIIEKIDIFGIDSISRGTVLEYLPYEVGDDVTNEAISQINKTLLQTNLFESVNSSFNDKTLSIKLVENPTIKYFEFKNFKDGNVLNEELNNDLLANFSLKPGDIFVKESLNKLLSQLEIIYKRESYFQTEITINSDLDNRNRIGIDLDIKEGEPALIRSINISGANVFKEDELLDLIEIGEPDFFLINYFTEKDHFSNEKLNAGIEKIKSKYLNSGYLGVKLEVSNIEFDKKENKITVEIKLDEGDIYSLGDINFSGDILNLSKDYLRSNFNISSGDPFARIEIVKGVQNIGKIYENNGFAFSNLKTDTSIVNNQQINVKIQIIPDDRIFINRIIISGNTRTQDDVIRRNFSILEGQRYSKEELDDSIAAVKRLGYFSDVKVDVKRNNTQPDRADILINVIETKTGEISIGLSHSNNTGAAINAGIKQTNILGTGNTLNATFTSSEALEETSLYFKDPHFNNSGHSISYGFFDRKLDASQIDTTSYTLNESGIILGYGVPASNTSNIFGEYRLSSIDLICGADLATYESTSCTNPKDIDSQISLTYSKNTLNDFYNPTSGIQASLNTKIGIPSSDYKYTSIEGAIKSYDLLADRYVSKLSSRFNLASGYGGDDLPFFKRYYEGGTSSIRGFNFNSLGSKYLNSKPKGGEFSFVSSAGIATPVDFLGIDNKNMKLFSFVDVGTISDKVSDFAFDELRASTGIGFTWLTPIGPIGAHIAKPILQKTGDQTETFSFNLGASF